MQSDYSYSSTQVNIQELLRSEIMDWGKENIPDEDIYELAEDKGTAPVMQV